MVTDVSGMKHSNLLLAFYCRFFSLGGCCYLQVKITKTSQDKQGNIELKVGRLYFKTFQFFYHRLVHYKSQI